jgi:hypothetical protein
VGEAKLKQTALQRLIKEFPNCYFCGGRRPAVTREHMPPLSLFDNSYRPNKLIMPACHECNNGTSTADLTAAIVSRWNYNVQSQEFSDYEKLVAQARKQVPDLVNEWMITDYMNRAEAGRDHLRRYGVPVPPDAGIVTIGPHTIRQLNLFAHKATLALYFEHFRKPLPTTGQACSFWRSKEDYARDGVPAKLLQIMPRYATLVQGRWDERKTFEYRYEINTQDGLFGFIAKLRKGLFVSGFAVANAGVLPSDATDWINPDDPTVLLHCQRFQRKN